MSSPRFTDSPFSDFPTDPGARNHRAGRSLEQRVAALEQVTPLVVAGTMYAAAMYAADSGSPTHDSSGAWQKVGAGGGTLTWASAFDTRPAGTSAQIDAATNKRIDIRKDGLYLVTGSIRFDTIADGKIIGTSIYIGGAAGPTQVNPAAGAAGGAPSARVQDVVSLASGNYLELYAYQDDSGSEAYRTSTQYTIRLSAVYLRPA